MAGIGREIIHKVLPSPNPSNFLMVNFSDNVKNSEKSKNTHIHDHIHNHDHNHQHHPYPHANHPLGPKTLEEIPIMSIPK